MVKYKCVYFAATGGAAAVLAKTVKSAEIIAYEDLGPEAIRRLIVEDFPVVVVNDCHGRDLYEEGRKLYERS
jgi:fumarate hydratase subunit beta